MSNTNTIIQEKVKELNNEVKKYPDLKFAIDRLSMAGALNLESWLTEALTSLVKEVREEEKKKQPKPSCIFDCKYCHGGGARP